MKIIVNLLIIALFSLSCEINYYKSKKELIDEQKEFAQKVLENPSVIETNWKNTKLLQVTVESDRLKKNESKDDNYHVLSNFFAEKFAEDGFEYTGLDTCVELINTKKETLSYACYPEQKK